MSANLGYHSKGIDFSFFISLDISKYSIRINIFRSLLKILFRAKRIIFSIYLCLNGLKKYLIYNNVFGCSDLYMFPL